MAAKIFLNQPAQTKVCSATIVFFVLFSSGYISPILSGLKGVFFLAFFFLIWLVPQMETINDFVTFEAHGVVRIGKLKRGLRST